MDETIRRLTREVVNNFSVETWYAYVMAYRRTGLILPKVPPCPWTGCHHEGSHDMRREATPHSCEDRKCYTACEMCIGCIGVCTHEWGQDENPKSPDWANWPEPHIGRPLAALAKRTIPSKNSRVGDAGRCLCPCHVVDPELEIVKWEFGSHDPKNWVKEVEDGKAKWRKLVGVTTPVGM